MIKLHYFSILVLSVRAVDQHEFTASLQGQKHELVSLCTACFLYAMQFGFLDDSSNLVPTGHNEVFVGSLNVICI
jgi:hypothetical protein